ncbi:exported hypothetical protein [Rhodospirillaceae bacterium LM-1]|nr:exported hypothetical protein [Rhodospirillaceae bacterium LM-1]
MSSTRSLILAGLGAVALGGTAAGLVGLAGEAPMRSERISLAMPPSLELAPFDDEETIIDTAFGPAMSQAVQLVSNEGEAPLTVPPPMVKEGEEEPPKPSASPVPKVEGPLPEPISPHQAGSAQVGDAPPLMAPEVQATVHGLRVGHSGDKTRVIIDLSASTDFAYSVGKDGKSVSLVLPGATWKTAAKGSTKAGGRITGYEYQAVDGGSKVILSASEPVEIVQVEPHPADGQGYQLVIDLVDAQGAQVRRGGMAFWWTKETPAKVAEAPPEPLPTPKVADATAAKSEPVMAPTPIADYKKARDWSGFYLGAQAGYDLAKTKEEHSVRGSKSHTVDGPEGGLFLGWGTQMGSLYLGGELAGAYAHASAKQKVDNGKHDLSKSWNYGGALRVGTPVFDDGLVYLKGGYQASSFKLASNRPGDAGAPSISKSKTLHGPLVGVGFDYLMTDNWFLRTDASYVFYNSMKYTDSAGGTGKISPNDISLRLGVAYKF